MVVKTDRQLIMELTWLNVLSYILFELVLLIRNLWLPMPVTEFLSVKMAVVHGPKFLSEITQVHGSLMSNLIRITPKPYMYPENLFTKH